MVSFRLSDLEYDELMTLCSSRGARSLSDLVRDAMQALLKDSNHNGNHKQQGLEVEVLLSRLNQMDQELKRLATLVDRPVLAAEESA